MNKIGLILTVILLVSTVSGIAHPYQEDERDETLRLSEKISPVSLYRITPLIQTNDLPHTAELVGGNPGEFHDALLNDHTKQALLDKGYQLELLRQNPLIAPQDIADTYHTFEEIGQILQTMATTYPNITQLHSIGKSYENREIWCLEITDNPGIDEDEAGVCFMGLHHAREWPTIEICLSIAKELTEGYQNDTTIKNMVDNRRTWIIPCVNPDGYVYDHDLHQGNKWWRKNREYFKEFNTYGIDLNRNYPGSCNGDPQGMWGSRGMSHNPSTLTYCGPDQFSAPETVALKQFFLNHIISASISYHTYSELVMWPWGYSTEKQTDESDYMAAIGNKIAAKIKKQASSGTYYPTQSSGLYPTTGDTTDWLYGYHHYVLGRPHFAYTIEACNEFHPDASYLDQVCTENVEGALYLLKEAQNISQRTPRVIPPLITDLSDENGAITIEWETVNPSSNPTVFEVQEFSNMKYTKESAEAEEPNLQLDGFFQSSRRANSGSHSYRSHLDENMVSSLTTIDPIFINQSMDFTFSCWYEIEENNDKAFVELSTDGRNYDVIDTFTGSSNGWLQRSYSLDNYLGRSIFIRFRYSTDGRITEDGFFVDDIYPVATYEHIKSIDDTITETSYTFSNKQDDQYYYRVRGYNNARGWGDYSMIASLNGITINNTAPLPPTITGPQRSTPKTVCSYNLQATDPDGHQIYYYINWGDGTIVNWTGPVESGETIILNHTWVKRGDYTIEARVKDEYNATSTWAELSVAMPKIKDHWSLFLILQRFLDHIGIDISLLPSN
ncbi:MAG: M14 family zinc carboxypeptidase [Thermoplasmatota archaeon]